MLQVPLVAGPRADTQYASTIPAEFELVTVPCYLSAVRPMPTAEDFSSCDAGYAFAASNGLSVRGHTLFWGRAIPPWLAQISNDSLLPLLRRHVVSTVSRYRGATLAWDVVNEAILAGTEQGVLYRDTSLWLSRFGPSVIDSAFHWARRADPDALLFYNDFGIHVSPAKAEAIYRFVRDLVERQVPIDGVGVQFHLRASDNIDVDRVRFELARLAELGLHIHVTELNVTLGTSDPTAQEYAQQAAVYRTAVELCLVEPMCSAIVFWGVTDRYRSRISVSPTDSPMLFDRDYRPKPAYHAVLEAITRANRSTRCSATTEAAPSRQLSSPNCAPRP